MTRLIKIFCFTALTTNLPPRLASFPAPTLPLQNLASSSQIRLPEAIDGSTADRESTIQDPYETVLMKLPWLGSILSDTGTIAIQSENYKLLTENMELTMPQCLKTPINGTTGICTPLLQCPQIFFHLNNIQIFNEYFCPLENKYVGVCCPTLVSTS